jgi:hypothetical protein
MDARSRHGLALNVSHLRHLSTIEGSAHALARAYVLTVPNEFSWWDVVNLTHWECFHGYDAIDIIKQIGGIPIIAHPKSIENDDIVLDLLRYGAQGLEVFHPTHSSEETNKSKQMFWNILQL